MRAALLDHLKRLFAPDRDDPTGSSNSNSQEQRAGREDVPAPDNEYPPRSNSTNPDSIVAGCVQLLGLDEIKERLGPLWDAVADKSIQIVEDVLNESLSIGDVFRPIGRTAFQICFESDDEVAARTQIAELSAAIYKRIVAELSETEHGVRVNAFVASVPAERFRHADDPALALYTSLLDIQREAAKRQNRILSADQLRRAGAVFQPLWPSRDFGNTNNRCLLDSTTGAAAAKHLERIDDLEDLRDALSTIDCTLLTRSIEGLHQAIAEVKQASVLVPVHFHTLASEHEEFLSLGETIPAAYRKFVLIELIGIPVAATRVDLFRALEAGRKIAHRMVLQLPPRDLRLTEQIRKLAWGLSFPVSELNADDPAIASELGEFVAATAELGLYSFAYGANTIGKASACATAGFDYIGGTAVHSTVLVPRPHSRFSPIFGEASHQGFDRNPPLARRRHPRLAPLNPNSTVTFPDGRQQACRVLNFSASGAAVSFAEHVETGSYLALGSLPAKVVRSGERGFAVCFLEVQQLSVVELALASPAVADTLLETLSVLAAALEEPPKSTAVPRARRRIA